MIYFDNAATTLIKPANVYKNLSFKNFGNPGRSGHSASMKSSEVIFDTRFKICDFFNINNPENVIFTYNATYALNIAISGIIREKCTVLTSGFEHNSTIRPLMANKDINVKIIESKLYNQEEFLENFENSIDKNTKYAVINHVSNVFGYILPIKEIDDICFKHGIKLILDISQSAGILDIDLSRFKSVLCACMPAHKSLYGTMGLGILVVLDEKVLKPIIFGGTGSLSQSLTQPDFLPDMLESGTPNVPAIYSLQSGLDYLFSKENISKYTFDLSSYFARELSKINNTTVYFCDDPTVQSCVVSFIHDSLDPEIISKKLSGYDICTRAGFHCSSLAHKTAKTNGTVRASFCSFNNFLEIDNFLDVYKKIATI